MDFGSLVAHATQGQLAYLQLEKALKAQTDARIQLESENASLKDKLRLLKEEVTATHADLEATEKWLDEHIKFYDPLGDAPVLKGKRVWYYATDDDKSYPFSSLVDE